MKWTDHQYAEALFVHFHHPDLIADAVNMIKEGRTPLMKSSVSDQKIEEGLLFFQDRCYVPQNIKLRQEITK